MNYSSILAAACAVAALNLTSCKQTDPVEAGGDTLSTQTPTIRTQTLLTGYEIIWGMDFLPNGDLIFGEKRGRLYRRTGETVTELTGLPTDISTLSQGGLLDIRVHPNYAANGWVYASYAASATGTTNTQLNLIRFKITGNALTDLQTIFRASATNQWKGHYGSRIEFDRNGFLYLSIGEGGPSTYG
ncbi:MAG: PQQ-dependent sugar dehydrogenase, partial [Cytophagaceae bacterium]